MQAINSAPATIADAAEICLTQTLLCGQAFRWAQSGPERFHGVAGQQAAEVWVEEGTLLVKSSAPGTEFWQNYFDTATDYRTIRDKLSQHPLLCKAVCYAPGIRVLRQDSWETLISFIISQNNHIGRISSIINKLCSMFGQPLPGGEYAFPTPERIALAALPELAPLHAGYRDKYILDAAQRVASGALDLGAVAQLSTDEARAALLTIKGVGRKVADCVLLYGFHRTEVCPMDVWMKRAMSALLPDGWPSDILPIAGIAQQFLFHYARTCPGVFK